MRVVERYVLWGGKRKDHAAKERKGEWGQKVMAGGMELHQVGHKERKEPNKKDK